MGAGGNLSVNLGSRNVTEAMALEMKISLLNSFACYL